MKYKLISLFVVTGLLLSACAKTTQNTDEITSGVFTAVAQTLTAQYTPITPTVATPTVESTATSMPTVEQFTMQAPTLAPTKANSCYNAAYVSDVTIPDGTTLTAGSSFTKTWSVKNTGTCAWTSSFMLKFASGTQMGGATTTISSAVPAGSSINVSVTMTAPTTPGSYTGYWRMASSTGELFGGYVSVQIVSAALPTGTTTVTPTITVTPSVTPVYIVVTATPGPTATGVSTNTPEPSATTGS